MRNLLHVLRWPLLLALTSCGGGSCSVGRTDSPDMCGSVVCADGTNGGRCRSPRDGADACDDGLVCYRSVCRPCGDRDEQCCFGQRCNGTLACEPGPGVTDQTCDDCGEPGDRCCAPSPASGSIFNVCHGGATCNIGTNLCEGGGTSPGPCGGPSVFAVGCVDVNGCGSVVEIRSTSQADAETCARGAGCTDTPAVAGFEVFDFCLDYAFAGNGGIQVSAFGPDDALRCARALSPARCYWDPIAPDTTSGTCLDDCTPCPGPGETPPDGCTPGASPRLARPPYKATNFASPGGSNVGRAALVRSLLFGAEERGSAYGLPPVLQSHLLAEAENSGAFVGR